MTGIKLRWVGVAGVAVLAGIFWINHVLAGADVGDGGLRLRAAWTWLGTLVLLIGFVALIGGAIAGRPAGAIIDNRNRISLSKFQAVAWTVLILSALVTATAARLGHGDPAPLSIAIPAELLAAMGLAATSLVATPALLSRKADAPGPSADRLAAAEADTGTPHGGGSAVGQVFGRQTAAGANWLDMFRGEEIDNAGAPDLSKIQQFLVSAILVSIYGALIWNQFADGSILGGRGTLPVLDENLIWLLGISHASYLAYKAVPHGASGQPGAASATDFPSDAVG